MAFKRQQPAQVPTDIGAIRITAANDRNADGTRTAGAAVIQVERVDAQGATIDYIHGDHSDLTATQRQQLQAIAAAIYNRKTEILAL